MCVRTGRGGKDVGIGNQRGARRTSPLARARRVREVSATYDSDGVAKADGSLMFPEVLRPAPGEGISARLIVPCRQSTSGSCVHFLKLNRQRILGSVDCHQSRR
jgi:hypothetical protein